MLIVIILIISALLALYLLRVPQFNNELFAYQHAPFITANNAEFRGINIFGISSDDGYVATDSVEKCQTMCLHTKECKGYSFYSPGNRCYMFMSGNFVPERPGFQSGKKIV